MRSTNGLPGRPSRRRRRATLAAVAALAAGSLTACGGSAKPVLNWYVNPDGVDTFQKYAKQCSTDKYDISVQLLPNGATDQRTQLARRLAAEDSSTDLMNLDPVFVAEFANAGWLQEVEGAIADSVQQSVEGEGDYLSGAAETVTWDDKVYAIPLWANTQVLWYRKSLAEAAGLDMTKPVTWDQVIDAASDQGGTVGVQANKYEAYVVWINALVESAGGHIIENPEASADEVELGLESDAGRAAAEIIGTIGREGLGGAGLPTADENATMTVFQRDNGSFMVNWPFVWSATNAAVEASSPADSSAATCSSVVSRA